jgi:membrane protein DedA with SNARE-associated domain
MSGENLEKFKRKAPQLLVVSIIVIGILVVLVDTLEDTLIEGGGFSGTPLAPLLSTMVTLAQSATATVSSSGYLGVFLMMFLESSSLPIPSEVILPFAGYLVSLGQLNLWLVIAAATLAGMTGSLVDYYIGMKGIDLLTRRKTLAHVLFSKARIERAERWFNKYGPAAVLLSRLIPGFRTLVSFPAGAVKMPMARFITYTTAGCLVWNAFLIYAGDYVGANWREIAGMSHYVIIVFLAAILIALAMFLTSRRKKHQIEKSELFHRAESLDASPNKYTVSTRFCVQLSDNQCPCDNNVHQWLAISLTIG